MYDWVGFPGLGINRIDISSTLVEFTLFGIDFNIRYYGVLVTLGLVLGYLYAYKQAPRLKIDRDRMFDVVMVAFIAAIVCTRLYYVIFKDPAYYFANPEKILAVWDGGLAIYGGIIGAFVAGGIMCRVKKVSLFGLFDLAAVGFLIGQGIGRWGNFFNQEAYGAATTLPWGMVGSEIGRIPVHPTFLYESLWCLFGALMLHIMFRKCYFFRGQIFASYLIWYGTERFLVEGLRTDSLYLGDTGIRVSQALSLVAIVGGITMMVLLALYHRRHPQANEEEGEGESKQTMPADEPDTAHPTTLSLQPEEEETENNTIIHTDVEEEV